jgi:hypothetical protein
MRLKFILVLVLVLVVAVGVALFFKQTPANQTGSLAQETNAPSLKKEKPSFTIITSTAPRVVGSTITPEKRAEAIEAEVDHLRELAMKDDPDSLAKILVDLTHPEKEVREAAIESAKEFGSSNAIPALKFAAQNNEDTQEKIALLQAAEFLTLPQLTFDNVPDSRTPEQRQAAEQKMADRIAQREAQKPVKKRLDSPPGTVRGSWSTTNNSP